MHIIERDDFNTPSLETYSELFSRHIQNALGDKDSFGENNDANKVRNFKYLKMIYETFNNHEEYAKTTAKIIFEGHTQKDTGPSMFGIFDNNGDTVEDDQYEEPTFEEGDVTDSDSD